MSDKIPIYHLDEIGDLNTGIAIFNFAHPQLTDYSNEMSQPHRHDHYCCFYIDDGYMDIRVDFQSLRVHQKSLLVSYPGQVHQSAPHQNCSGWMLVFDAKLIHESAKVIVEGSGTNVALIELNDEESEWLKKLFELLLPVVHHNENSLLRNQLTRSLLDAFVYQVCIFSKSKENTVRSRHSSRNLEITDKFRQLVKQHFRSAKRPAEYAEEMNFSVSYLNDTVRAVTGFSLTYFIQQEIVGEAQRLLYYSNMSIREVAYSLGYEDDKYFIRLFGKVTGSSPANFRKVTKINSNTGI